MRGAIAWSHDLLSAAEQAIFRRLAVFVGGFTIEAAEVVAAGNNLGIEVIDGVTALVDASLLRREGAVDGEPRYLMLETIREFGLEALAGEGEETAIRHAHAAYFLALGERAAPELHRVAQRQWLDRLESDHDKLRAALAWFDRTGQGEEFVHLAWLLLWFWWISGHLPEGRDWFERAIIRAAHAPAEVRAWALLGAARFTWITGNPARTEELVRQVEALAVTDDQPLIKGLSSVLLSSAAGIRGEFTKAAALTDEALPYLRQAGEAVWEGVALGYGVFIAQAGAVERGITLIEEALARDRARGDHYQAGVHLIFLGVLAHDAADEVKARRCYSESVRLLLATGAFWYLPTPLVGLATLAAARHPVRTARLLGAAAALYERSGEAAWATDKQWNERAASVARALLGPEAFDREWATGRAMTPAEAVAEAEVMFAPATEGEAAHSAQPGVNLSPREVEVLRLLVDGRSDREIAVILFISPRTASKHVASILAKLGVASRGEAAVQPVRAGVS